MKTPGQTLFEMMVEIAPDYYTDWSCMVELGRSHWEALATRVQPANPWVCSTERLPTKDDGEVEVYYILNGNLYTLLSFTCVPRATVYWRRFTPPAPKDPFEEWWEMHKNAYTSSSTELHKVLAKEAWNASLNHRGKEKE